MTSSSSSSSFSSKKPYVRVSLVLLACVMVYGVALLSFKNGYQISIQPTPKTTTTTTTTPRYTGALDFPAGYSTGIIEFLHDDTPRSTMDTFPIYEETDNTFRAGEEEYWYGAAYLSAVVLMVVVFIVFCCGIPCCILGFTNCCGKNTFTDNKAPQMLIKSFMVVALVLVVACLATAFWANVEANNEFIPIMGVPNQLLDGLNDKLTTIQEEAESQNITVPEQITKTQKTLQNVQNDFDDAIPDAIKDIVDAIYDSRNYAFIIVFCLSFILCVFGVVGIFLLRGKPLTCWLGLMFLLLLILAICGTPLLFVNTVVADVCIESNDIIMRPINDNTTAEITIFYLFCPDDFVPDLDFVDQLINDTQIVLEELEEGKEEAEDGTDTELVADYDERIQQTQNLLSLEESLYYCNGTSQQYNDIIDDTCQDSLKWNWVLMWLLFAASICLVLSLCIGFGAVMIIPPKGESSYIDIPYDVVD